MLTLVPSQSEGVIRHLGNPLFMFSREHAKIDTTLISVLQAQFSITVENKGVTQSLH